MEFISSSVERVDVPMTKVWSHLRCANGATTSFHCPASGRRTFTTTYLQHDVFSWPHPPVTHSVASEASLSPSTEPSLLDGPQRVSLYWKWSHQTSSDVMLAAVKSCRQHGRRLVFVFSHSESALWWCERQILKTKRVVATVDLLRPRAAQWH